MTKMSFSDHALPFSDFRHGMQIHTVISLVLVISASANVLNINKGVIVHLFEWRWADIAKECEEFLAPFGFAGVQISPPSENIIINSPPRPWWERYQPISYKLTTRSGTEAELQDMLDRCNKVGVRIFADAVINHMTGPSKEAVGTDGSTAEPLAYSYPVVPYSRTDFHQPSCRVNNYNNATEVRNCELLGLRDLDQSKPYVRRKLLEYMNKLIEMGVAGFRVDAAKHIWPSDLGNIFDRLDDLSTTHGFPPDTRPFIFMEVIDNGGEAVHWQDYSPLGMVTDFRYGTGLREAFLDGRHDLSWFKKFGSNGNLLPNDIGIVFVDNHDTQRENQLNYKSFRPYKMAIAFMLAYPWGTPKILSSYYFDTTDQGPPHDSEYHILSPRPINNNVCSNKWVCEHRWRQIYNMVRFHNVVTGTEVMNWWDNGKNQIAFCRGNKGFIALNKESYMLNKKLQTCLPKGKYCDVVSGNLINNMCTGKMVEVGEDGMGTIEINPYKVYDPNVENDGVLALHIKAKILDDSGPDASHDDDDHNEQLEGSGEHDTDEHNHSGSTATPSGSKTKPPSGNKPSHGDHEGPQKGGDGSKPSGDKPSQGNKPSTGSKPKPSGGSEQKPSGGSEQKPPGGSKQKPPGGSKQKPPGGSKQKPPGGSKPSHGEHAGDGSKPSGDKPSPGSKPTGGNKPKPSGGNKPPHGGHKGDGSKPSGGKPSQGNKPSGGDGDGSACDKLLKLLLGTDKEPSLSSILGQGIDDLALLRVLARIRKMEKLLDLLSIV